MAAESFAERLWEGIDDAVSPYDVPEELVENLKTDLKDAFGVKGKARPGYEPGAVASIRINLIDALTNPLKTVKKTFNAFRGELDRPPVPLAWTDAEDTIWQRVFTTAGVDLRDMPIVPRSLQDAILRWNAGARKRTVRLIREEKGIRESPGLTLMMAQRLNYYHASLPGAPAPIVAGVMLPQIVAQAQEYESYVAGRLAVGDWAAATELQVGKQPRHPVTGAQIPSWEKASESYRDALRKEFERVARLGGQPNASAAANALANSDEAKFWRYWQNRNLYFKTLNFLNTWRKDGFWGMVREYGWKTFTKYAFKEKTWRYWLYPPNVINKGLGWVAKRVRLTAALTRLTDWRQRLKNFWGRTVKRPLRKALDWIRERVIRKAVSWLITKLGLKVVLAKIGALIGGAIGTAAPGIGNAIGAVLGAVVSFIGGIIADYAWKYVLKGALYIFGAAFGCLALAAGGGVLFVVLVLGSVFAPGAGGPGAGPGPLPTPSPVKVEKKVGEWNEIAIDYRDELQYPVANVQYKFSWRIEVINTGSETATVTDFQDDICKPIKGGDWPSSFSLEPGEANKRTIFCEATYWLTPTRTIANIVTGKATVDTTTKSISDMAKIVIGEPLGCQLNVPYFCQSDSQWEDTGCCWPSGSYPDCDDQSTIGHAGCGCTSQVMIINYHGGSTTPPEQCGTHGCHVSGLTADYLPCSSADLYFEAAKRYLCDQNRPLIAIRKPSLSSSEWDHYAVITGVDPVARTVTLNDPYFTYSFCVPGLRMSFEDFYWEAARASPQCLVWY